MAGSGQDPAMYANAMYSQGFSSGSQVRFHRLVSITIRTFGGKHHY